MTPLLSGPELVRLGAKLLDALGSNGNTFSTAGEACVTTQVLGLRPANWALSALIASFLLFKSVHAFTMLRLFFGSNAADRAISDGTVKTDVDPRAKRSP